MLKKTIALAAVCAASLFADEAPAKKYVNFGHPGWGAGKADILQFIAEKLEPFKDTAANYETSKAKLLALAEVNETQASTYPEIKAIVDKYLQEGETFVATGAAVQICYCLKKDVKAAYQALQGKDPYNYARCFYLNKDRSDIVFTPDQIYDWCIHYLTETNGGAVKEAVNQIVRVIPNVTKKENEVLADLKKLNRKFSPYLLDDKKKDTFEPIVAKIRTMIATY